jgi:RNA polymerase sigma-70 factor (ECF subfamily)
VINIDDASLQNVISEINESYSEEKEDALLSAIQVLDEEEVQLLEMRFFEKRQFKEIAEIKDSTESAVKMKVYRLLEKLKGIMEKK